MDIRLDYVPHHPNSVLMRKSYLLLHHRCQFRDFSRYFVGASLQMPPLWGLGLWLMYVSTQMLKKYPSK